MAKIPASVRAWRAPVSDAFNDNRFFRPTEQDPQAWKRLICALMDSEKERFGELQGELVSCGHGLTLRPDHRCSLGQHLHEPRTRDDYPVVQPPPAVFCAPCR